MTADDSKSRKLKPILIVSHGYLPEFGGMEQFAGRLSVALHQAGHEVEVVTTPRIYNGVNLQKSLIRPLRSMEYGFPVYSLGHFRKFWQIRGVGCFAAGSYFLSLLLFVIRNRKRFRGIIVFAILRDFAWLCFLKKFIPSLPIVGVESSCGPLLEYRTVRKNIFGALYQRFIYSSKAKIVAFGEAILNDYRGLKFDEKRLIVIPNGITNFGKIHPYNPHAKQIVDVGRLSREKGFDILVDAFSLLKNKDVNLVIRGTGIEKEKLELQVSNYNISNRVVFHSSSSKETIADVFKDALLGVVASRVEGMSSVQLEAMSLGIPMVVTDVGCNAEVFNLTGGTYGPDGFAVSEFGVLVPSENAGALSRAIDYLINNEEKRVSISQNVQIRFGKRFDISCVANEYSRLFNGPVSF